MRLIENVFNHIVLPPNLPGKADETLEEAERDVLSRLFQACDKVNTSLNYEYASTFDSFRHSLQSCLQLSQGHVEKTLLLEQLRALKINGLIIVPITQQNAALLIHRYARYANRLLGI